MTSLRTAIRFLIILVFLVLLVFLSIFLFKLIPKAVNQLANASLSITNLDNTNNNTKSSDIATTTGSLNGSIISSNVSDTNTSTSVSDTSQIQILDNKSDIKTKTIIKKSLLSCI